MIEFVRDLRYAGRSLHKSPAAAGAAVLALALGVGVNATSYASVNALILNPFPFPRLERIFSISEANLKANSEHEAVAPANYLDLSRSSKSFERLAAYRIDDGVLAGSAAPVPVRLCRGTPGFFPVLGMRPELGQLPPRQDDTAEPIPVAILSNGFWKSHFGGENALFNGAVSKPSLVIDGRQYEVIGVMPDEFDYPLGTDVWLPLKFDATAAADRKPSLAAIGLLSSGVTARQAQDEASSIAARLAGDYPTTNEGRTLRLTELSESTSAVTNRFLEILLCAAGFVLLLACANVANLQLARAANRRREIIVRAAMGASRLQIARGLLAESLWIALLACPVGLLLALWGIDRGRIYISGAATRNVPGLRTMHLDYHVVLYSFVVSLAAGVVCSLPAILQIVRPSKSTDWGDALRARSGGAQLRIHGLRSALIAGELALSLVLLVGAGLMVGTFNRLLHLDQGFDPRNVLAWRHALPAERYPQASDRVTFYDRALARIYATPGVKSAGVEMAAGTAEAFHAEGKPEPRPEDERPDITAVSAHYFDAMRIPLRRGRSIAETDRPESQKVVVLSEGLARHYWGDADPLGRRVQLDKQSGWWTVVGIVGDIKHDWFNGVPSPEAYIPYPQRPSASSRFRVLAQGDPSSIASAMQAQILQIDKDLPVLDMRPYEKALAEERGGVEAAASTMSTYALAALLLAVTGVYAVISFFVAARTHDIGVRMALGATPIDVAKLTLAQTLRLLTLGLGIGLPLSWGMAHAASAALYGVVHFGPGTFIGFAAALTVAALLASYLPSRRAAHIDPIAALRVE